MKEEIERYLELALFLRNPNNSDASEDTINLMLDELDAIWTSTSEKDHKEIDELIRTFS